MSNDLKTFKIIAQSLIDNKSTGGIIIDSLIEETVDILFETGSNGLNISVEDKNKIRNELLTDNRIRLEPGVAIIPITHKEWFLQRKSDLSLDYWDRFKQFISNEKNIPLNVVTEIDKMTDKVVDLLGDPTRAEGNEQRRGLIIGDVQSGKTLNYSGMVCKAVDAGYRVVIILTGTTNDLRKQTQMRLDEAFVGTDSESNTLNFIGVGKYNTQIRPISFTSVTTDFKKSAVRQMSSALSRDENGPPMLFVIKKNVSVLRNLTNWIKTNNQYGESKIDRSVLMIDDEADYASVNTKKDYQDRSKTNAYIEDLLNSFRFSSYVGFTATPYANVFIDPETDEEMEQEGLFPKDYIYVLNSPSNYIGARDIFYKDSRYHSSLRLIEDGEDYYPLRHKKDSDFEDVSPSLMVAINTFLLANVIQDLRGMVNTHRSMMINVTLYNDTQKLVKKAVLDYFNNIKRSIGTYSSLPTYRAIKDEHIGFLYEVFNNEYSDVEFSWEEIQDKLYSSLKSIEVLGLYGGGDDLNYDESKDGLRTIVVGGHKLSRGLTLEGLIVSYIYRNSKAYDTLMQMGRWFGYRDNYADICRIWMSADSQDWYKYISEATDELRREVQKLRDSGATPLDFGLKVRNDSDIPLTITAKNKMWATKSQVITKSLSEKSVETPFIYNNHIKNEINIRAIKNLSESINFKPIKNKYLARLIPKDKILNFINRIEVPNANAQFDIKSINDFIKGYAKDELDLWDVAIMSGDSELQYILSDNIRVTPINRKWDFLTSDNEIIRISKSKRRLGSISNSMIGLTKEQISEAKKIVEDNPKRKAMNGNDYFAIKRNPLLMIYFVDLVKENNSDDSLKLDDFKSQPLIGFSLGIPKLGDMKTKYIRYQTNKIYHESGGIDEFEDENEDENE